MPPLTPTQKSLLTQFMSITGVPERNATKLLKTSGWKLEQACESTLDEKSPIATIIYIAMDATRAAFENRPNILLPTKKIYGVQVNKVLVHFWRSRHARRDDQVKAPSTYQIGLVATRRGIWTTGLLHTSSEQLQTWKAISVTTASNMETNYIIAPSPPGTLGGQLFKPVEDATGYRSPPCPYSPSPASKAGQHPSQILRSKLRYRGKSFSPTGRSWKDADTDHITTQLLKDYLVESFVENDSTTLPDPAVSKIPCKLDPTRMFEMRKSISKTNLMPSCPSDPMTSHYLHREVDCEDFMKLYSCFEEDTNTHSSYFSSNGTPPMTKEKDALGKVFENYRDPKTDEVDLISVEGTMNYLGDLGIDMESAEFLVPLEIVQAPALGEITKDGFIDGWKNINGTPDTVAKQKAYVAGQITLMKTDMVLFKRVYRHAFICSKEKGQKALALENALVYWEMLFGSSGKPWVTSSTNFIELWLEFLKAKWTKSVNKDMWNQTFEFFQKSLQDESLSFWSEDGAWPGVIDDFVAYAKEKRGDVPENMETD